MSETISIDDVTAKRIKFLAMSYDCSSEEIIRRAVELEDRALPAKMRIETQKKLDYQ